MTKRIVLAFPQEGLQFLRSLKRHNNREWFLEHKSTYENHVKQPMTDLIEELAVEFKTFAPEMIASPKVSSYRIHRDTRFSNDKSPYKTHVAAVFPRTGLAKHEGAGFYLHIAPDELLIGGGLYMPLPEDLRAIRAHIAESPQRLIGIVKGRSFRKLFGEIRGEKLSRVPRGFPADHPAADYLRHKQFLAGRTFDSQVATTRNFFGLVVETFRTMLPLVRFLNEPILAERRTRERQQAMLEL
jgi:uncharacterized protein (TIGR02453 family)